MRQVLATKDIDYLVSDYLDEITMALLARARAEDPSVGYVQDAIATLAPVLPEINERGIKVVTNAGALNAGACADALRAAAREAGTPLRVAAVEGDDLMPRLEEIMARRPRDMFTNELVPASVSSMDAFLGARPIAQALDLGADIVVTGRCVGAAVVLGPLMHEYGWGDEDYDRLAAGSLAGHIIECGPQCTGGIHTDWERVPGWGDLGYPVADVGPDGVTVISKPPGTGGLVTVGTVGEQILHAIGDPGAYVMPDVICDWREVNVEQVGPNRVQVSGTRGSAPTTSYKVTATYQDGYRAMTTAMFSGIEAGGRARRAGVALVGRTEHFLTEDGFEPLTDSSIEVIGAGDTFGPAARSDAATEAVLKVGVQHPDKEALEIFAGEFAPLGLVAQGMTGGFAGPPRVAPVFSVFNLLVDKSETPVTVRLDGDAIPVAIAPGVTDARISTPTLADAPTAGAPPVDIVEVPLKRLAFARSGDRGDNANIGVLARRSEYAPLIHEQLTAQRVAAFFAHYRPASVQRWELPGLNAINFLIDGVLGGSGGTSTLRYDPNGKSYAAMLLTLPIQVPADWDLDAVLTDGAPVVGEKATVG
jgi:Acyclic terpene utilisation family protein AtuA